MFVEPDPRYRDPYEVDDDTEAAGEVVLLEDGDGALLAHSPGPALLDGRLYFVDGVRRTDFRAHDLMADGTVVRGLGGSFGVGAVCFTPKARPVFDRMEIHRLLLWTHGYAEALPAVGGWAWTVE